MGKEYHRPPIRVALMGLGRAMLQEHFPVFKAHPALFNVVSACDILKERRDIIAETFPDCRMYRQYTDMLDDHDLDLIIIASCTTDHVAHALESLGRDKWTLLESPIALTLEDAQILRGAAMKAKNRLIPLQRGIFAPDYLLAKQMLGDQRLGEIYDIRIRVEDYIRRDDWQCVKRLGGGAAYYAMTDLVLQTLKLLPAPPVQMWSELKRIASLGDAEDYVRMNLKTRTQVSADVEFNGGVLPSKRSPSFTLRGERGEFKVMPGEQTGVLTVIDPKFAFPRRRSSVRTPPVEDMHESFPVIEEQISLPRGTPTGMSAFWRQVYSTVRTASPFPVTIEEEMDAIKFIHLMKKTSNFAK